MDRATVGDEPGWRTGPAADRGRYVVGRPEPLAGGEGFVFEATGPDGPVALKLLGPLDDHRLEVLRERWERVAMRPHPRLARPIELFRGPGLFTGGAEPPDEDCDLVYAAAAWAAGEPLRAAAPLPLPAVAPMVQDIAAAVSHLHSCGLVHRDLHPGNVVVDADGHATLIDLGAIRPDDSGHTSTIAGTLGFIAPERTHEPGDRRADAWGLGMLTVFAVLGHPKGRQSDGELRHQLDLALAGVADRRRAVDLLLAMIDADPDDRPTDLGRWASDLATVMAPVAERAPRRHWPVAAALVALAAAAGAVVVVARSDDDAADPAASAPSPSTSRPVACTPDDFPATAMAAVAGSACPIGTATTFGDALVQPVATDDGPAAVISSDAGTVLLSEAQFASYREIAGRERPENAITFGGYPVAVTDDGDVQVIELSFSGVIVGDRSDTQAYWMPDPVQQLWEERGGTTSDLGLPMSNPYFVEAGLLQDFAGGTVLLPADVPPFSQVDPSILVVTIDDDPGSGLEAVDVDGRFLRQPTGTVWFVDHGTRHWVPTAEVYGCLGGDAAVVADAVAGSDIASIPLGAPAGCPGG